jgi:nicotinate-nucleotide pyrophosphorylase (carboxylating)
VASVVTRQNGILCGLALALAAFQHLAPELSWQCELQDGARIKKGQTILKIKGPTRSLLSAERIALNFLGLLSGIATKTAIYVQQISGTQAKILDTRKTLPLYRSLQKYAVRVGGGFNHRMGLF